MVRVKIGDKYNRLLVVEYLHSDHHYRKYWKCLCDCGNEHTTHSGQMTSGNTKSCGCLASETKRNKRLPNDYAVRNQIYLQYKRHARTRNINFNISLEDFSKLLKQNCYYCDTLPSNIKTTKNYSKGYSYSGVDRIDNKKGYYNSNVVACCKQCNISKRDLTKDEFIDWVKKVAEQWG